MIFENLKINIEDLPNFEDINLTSISRKYAWVIAFNLLLFSGFFLIGIYVFHFFKPDFFGKYFSYIFFSILGLLILKIIHSYFAFFTKKYGIRSHDIIYQSGLIKKSTIIIPIKRIQHVELEEGWISRYFNLKSIAIFTAGQDGGDIKINGLEKNISEKINQLILNKIKIDNKIEEQQILPLNTIDEL